MIATTRLLFTLVIAFLIGSTTLRAQETQQKDSATARSTSMEYAGTKTVETNKGKPLIRSFYAKDNERVINDTEMSYGGKWEFDRLLARNSGYFCNTRAYSKEEGASATYRFQDSEGIIWYAQPVKDSGSAAVYIDDKFIKVVDCSKPGSDGIVFNSGKLERGEHRITIVAKSGTVEIDRLLSKGKVSGPVTIDAANRSFVQYTTGFSIQPASLNMRHSLAVAHDDNEEWEFYAKGSTIRCFGESGPDAGIMRIYINDKFYKDINLSSKKKSSGQLLFEIKDLAPGQFNRIKAVVISRGKKIAIERFVVNDPTCLMVEMNWHTDEEIAKMSRHETTASDPSGWKPVTMAATPALKGVTLGAGVLQSAFDKNVQYLSDCLKLPHWVRGKDPNRIWIDILTASNEGRMLGGMGHSLRYREIPEFRKAIDDIMEEIDRRQYANGRGYMMPYESANYKISTDTWPWIMRDEQKNYDRAMLTKGLLAVGSAGHTKAYELLRPFYDWYNNAKEYLPLMLLGSMGIQGSIAGPMVYHSPIGKPDDIQTNMKYYDMDWWLDALAQGHPEAAWRFTLNRPHNYLLTSICALFDIYKATGEERYLNACLGAWKIYHDYFQTPGGGISLCEHFECKPKTHKLTNLPNNIYETCGNVFWIDLNHRFLQLWPGNELYASQIEQSIYNFILPAQANDGTIRYFNQLNETKFPSFRENTCCEIQATAMYGMLPQYIYSQASDGVYINLFAASAYDFKLDSVDVKLAMHTKFPYGKEVSLKVAIASPLQMKLRIRVPSWLAGDFNLKVNGKKIAKAVAGSYVTIDRTWNNADEISWELPMGWTTEQYIGETRINNATRYAFTYGPLLMAIKGPMMPEVLQAENEPSIRLKMTPETLMRNVRHSANPCDFTIEGEPAYTLTPYMTVEGAFTCFPGMDRGALRK